MSYLTALHRAAHRGIAALTEAGRPFVRGPAPAWIRCALFWAPLLALVYSAGGCTSQFFPAHGPESWDIRAVNEATEGLAPLIRTEIWQCIRELRREGQAILLVDKHLDALTKLADRHVILEKGHVVWTGDSAALTAGPTIRQRWLQV